MQGTDQFAVQLTNGLAGLLLLSPLLRLFGNLLGRLFSLCLTFLMLLSFSFELCLLFLHVRLGPHEYIFR